MEDNRQTQGRVQQGVVVFKGRWLRFKLIGRAVGLQSPSSVGVVIKQSASVLLRETEGYKKSFCCLINQRKSLSFPSIEK